MSTNPKHINKLAPAKPAPLTEEEKAAQIARFFAQKREQFFQGILFNAIQSANIVPVRQGINGKDLTDIVQYDFRPLVDAALVSADYAIEKLYPVPKEGETK